MKRRMKQRWQSEEDAPDNPGPSRRKDVHGEHRSDESMSNDPILHSNHKIFLSHSGAQKDFVEQLCGDLERRYHFPFFDRRPSSLPKGERFPELILVAAQQCEMAVVVVSEEYFVSKWPMIELHAFVQARLRSNTKLKILPLFYGLSIQEYCNESRRDQWFSLWEDWAKIDSRINIDEWKESLKMLVSFNGIEYNLNSRGVEAYRESIVSNICKEVSSDIKWDDSHVQGRSSLCQNLGNRIQQIQPSEQYGIRLIGIYGVGGIGKTTICKTLCNTLAQEFKGKVSHVELGSQSSEELLREVLKDLTNTNRNLLQQLKNGECRHILRNGMYKQRTFLAVDNVWDDSKSIEEAKMYLQARFHVKSVVIVTSRSLKTLTYLGMNRSHCFEMPGLEHEDAKNLFLHHAANGIQFSNHDKLAIKKCITLCYFHKGDNKSGHFLPLALKALGVQLGCIGNKPLEWVKALPKVRDFNYLQEEHNPVFSILRSSFDRLRPIDQSLFMDLILYSPMDYISWRLGLMEWLSLVYNQDLQEIHERVQRLKERGLLEDVDMTAQRVSVHDLYREFAKLESQGKLNESADLEKRRWVYCKNAYPAELEITPSNGCWQNLIRIGILESFIHKQLQSLQGIEWRYCSNVVVLTLSGSNKLRGDMNLEGLKCLRSLELIRIGALDSLDGLQDLNNLTYFRWIYDSSLVHTRMGQLPASLKVLQVAIGLLLRQDVFARCTNLSKLELELCRAENLDFSNCTSLQSVSLKRLGLLETVLGLSAASKSSLKSLKVFDCQDLVEIPGLGDLVGLQLLHLHYNCKLKLPDLQKVTRLQVLDISGMGIVEVPGLGCLRQLRQLNWTSCFYLTSINLPANLCGCQQLQTVDLSKNSGLSSLEGVLWDLPALRCLDLSECESLRRLPDLSRLMKLEELSLSISGIELREEDMCMLASLPLLEPVRVGRTYPLRLDVVRRKVLRCQDSFDNVLESYEEPSEGGMPGDSWLAWDQWEEMDLGMLPITVQEIEWRFRYPDWSYR